MIWKDGAVEGLSDSLDRLSAVVEVADGASPSLLRFWPIWVIKVLRVPKGLKVLKVLEIVWRGSGENATDGETRLPGGRRALLCRKCNCKSTKFCLGKKATKIK